MILRKTAFLKFQNQKINKRGGANNARGGGNMGKMAFCKTHVLQERLLYTIHMSGEFFLPMAQTHIRCTSRNTQFEISLVDLKWKT